MSWKTPLNCLKPMPMMLMMVSGVSRPEAQIGTIQGQMMKKGIVRLKIERIIKVLLLKMRGKDNTEK